jgi:RimJ/RimL family protein N-acetyltransferase
MELVKCEEKYWEAIRQLRNMDGVKQGFIQQEEISVDRHNHYMKKNNDFFYICVDKKEFLGYTGIIDRDIRVATHPKHQKKGVASFMINEVMKIHPNAYAKVKIENEASLRLFKTCGFEKKYFILEKKDET